MQQRDLSLVIIRNLLIDPLGVPVVIRLQIPSFYDFLIVVMSRTVFQNVVSTNFEAERAKETIWKVLRFFDSFAHFLDVIDIDYWRNMTIFW